MTPMLDDDLIAAQHEVQRRLGDCLLQLQDYELRLKRLLAVSDIRHTSSGHGQITCDTSADLHRKTLGMLAGELMGSFFMVEGESFDGTKLEDAEPSGPTITFRARIALRWVHSMRRLGATHLSHCGISLSARVNSPAQDRS